VSGIPRQGSAGGIYPAPPWEPHTRRKKTRRGKWSGKRDSNPRPRPWQGRALPTELFPLARPGPGALAAGPLGWLQPCKPDNLAESRGVVNRSGSRLTRRPEAERIPNVADLRIASGTLKHLHHVEAARPLEPAPPLEPGERQPRQARSLTRMDRFARPSVARSGAGLDFHEDDHRPVRSHEVQLAEAAPPAAIQDAEIRTAQGALGGLLTSQAERLAWIPTSPGLGDSHGSPADRLRSVGPRAGTGPADPRTPGRLSRIRPSTSSRNRPA
jgi:hypothetical protein